MCVGLGVLEVGGGRGGRGKVGVCRVGKQREEGREENIKIWRRHEEGRGGQVCVGKALTHAVQIYVSTVND